MSISRVSWAWSHSILSLAFSVTMVAGPTVRGQLSVDFDGGGNTPYSLSNDSGDGSGTAPEILPGGPTGNFMRLTSLTNSNNNSVALDENQSVTGPAPNGKRLTFDFRISGSADGMGIGYFGTPLYGATGPSNPAAADGASPWETPVFPSAAVVGLRIYDDVDVVTLNAFGGTIADVDVRPLGLDLNSGEFHRGIFTVEPDPADADKSLWSVDIIADFYGADPVPYTIVDKLPTDVDLKGLPLNRVIAGGRTGGVSAEQDIDNITVDLIPEPGSITLFSIATAGLTLASRRRRVR